MHNESALLAEEHQLLLMALALLASSNPVMAVALRSIAWKLGGAGVVRVLCGAMAQ